MMTPLTKPVGGVLLPQPIRQEIDATAPTTPKENTRENINANPDSEVEKKAGCREAAVFSDCPLPKVYSL
jgi:hypothetical protein